MYCGIEVKFVRNKASLDVTNNTQETVIFLTKANVRPLDLRLLGYYKVKQDVLHQNLSKCYHFESAEGLCEEFNTLVNKIKKDEQVSEKDKYPWLEDSDERKQMTDKEILDKYIDLDNSLKTNLDLLF